MKKISKKRQQPNKQLNLFQVSLALLGIIFILISCDSCRKPKVDPVDPPDPPVASTLKINSFAVKAGSITTTGAGFDFSTTSNKTITIQSLIDTVNSKVYDVIGKTTFSVNNLLPGKSYPFTLYVKDASGKEVKQSLTVTTEAKKSSWLKSVELVYPNPTSMDRNTQSDTLKLKIVSIASATKTIDSLVVDFGTNGKAIKILRYREQDTASWTILQPSGTHIKFTNLKLATGENIIPAIFAIKKDPPGSVSNNAQLTLKVVSIDDGEGGTRAIEDFPHAIQVGSVNTVTEPTYIDPTFGVQYQASYGNISIEPGTSGEPTIGTIDFKFIGPNGAKIKSVRLYNPYYEFTGLIYSNWLYQHFNPDISRNSQNINIVNWESGQKYVTLDFTNTVDAILDYNQWGNYNEYNTGARIYNPPGNSTFESYDYTPGEYEWYLLSPFDLLLLDVNGDIVDMSDAPPVSKKT